MSCIKKRHDNIIFNTFLGTTEKNMVRVKALPTSHLYSSHKFSLIPEKFGRLILRYYVRRKFTKLELGELRTHGSSKIPHVFLCFSYPTVSEQLPFVSWRDAPAPPPHIPMPPSFMQQPWPSQFSGKAAAAFR